MKPSYSLFLLFFCAFVQVGLAQWTALPNAPGEPRDDGIAAVVKNRVYTGTGRNAGFQLLADWWQFTPNSNAQGEWQQRADVPFSARQYAMIAASTEYIYVFGGIDIQGVWQNDFWQYNPTNDSWLRMPDFPGMGRGAGVLFYINGAVYAGLGWNGTTVFNDFYKFNFSSSNWERLSDFPSLGMHWVAYCSSANQGFVGWGRSEAATQPNLWWRFNALFETWHTLPGPVASSQERGVAAGSSQFVIAGFGNDATEDAKNTVFQFSESNWRSIGPADLPARRGNNLVLVQNELHSLWGLDSTLQRTASHFVVALPEIQDPYRLYPNPAVEAITVVYNPSETKCWIINKMGQSFGYQNLNSTGFTTLSTNYLAPGIYVLIFESGKTLRFVVG